MTGFDTRTLVVMAMLISGLIGIFCRVYVDRDSNAGLLRAWGATLLMITAGSLMHMTRLFLPELLGVVVGNGLFLLSTLTIDKAVRRFSGESLDDPLGWWLSGLTLAALGALCLASPDLRPRGALFSTVIAVLLIRLAWRLEYRRVQGVAVASRFCAQVFGVWAIMYILRAAYFAASPPWTDFFAADAVVALTFAVSILMFIGATLGLTWMEILSRDRQLRAMESRDQLTGLLNRSAFLLELEDEVRRCAKTAAGFVLVVLDIDKFERVNARLGWTRGDGLLKSTAVLIEATARWEDVTARIAGDRFALLLRDPDPARAMQRAHVLCSALGAKLTDSNRERETVTVSGGVACFPANGRHAWELLQSAEAALVSAKLTGNAVEQAAVAPEPRPASA